MLVRTGPEDSKHKGITWLVVPMDTPGIDIRPLRTIAGSTEFAELFLDDVRVPVANRVGDENDGWRVTMVTLSFERGTAFVGELLQSMELLRSLRDVAAAMDDGARFTARIGHIGAELDALWALTKRNVSQAARTGVPGVGGSVFKLAFSELRQRLGELGTEIAGRAEPRVGRAGRGPVGPVGRRAGERRARRHVGQRLLAHDRRGDVADPAEHRRRADPRPPEGLTWTSS